MSSRVPLSLSCVALAALSTPAAAQRAPVPVDPAAAPTSAEPAPAPDALLLGWGDVDGDGLLDALALRAERPVVLLQQPDGAFHETPVALDGAAPARAAGLRDFDRDGFADLLVALPGPRLRLYRNDGFLAFDDVTVALGLAGESADHAEWLDLDGDEFPDLLVAGADGLVAYRNVEGRAFEAGELPAELAWEAVPVAPPATPTPSASALTATGGALGGERRPGGPSRPLDVVGRRGSSPRSSPGTPPLVAPAAPRTQAETPFSLGGCLPSMSDQAGGGCLVASSEPALGALYPLSEALFVATDGRVGMGTTSPVADLHVVGSGTTGRAMIAPGVAGSSGDSELFFAEDDDGSFGMRFTYDGGTNKLELFGESGSSFGPHLSVERQFGNVGLGTSDPAGHLHVLGEPSDARIVVSTDNAVAGGTASLWLGANTDASVAVIQEFDTAAGQYRLRSQVGGLQYGPHLAVNAVDGRVGIGTTAPEGDLHVQGSAAAARLYVTTSDSASSGEAELVLGVDSGADDAMVTRYDATSQHYQVLTSFQGTEYGPHLSIASVTGRVGIGTDAPVDAFHVAGDSASGRVLITPAQGVSNQDAEVAFAESHSGSLGMTLYYDGGVNQLQVRGQSASAPGTPHLVVARDSGNVGIGTTSPSARLHVSGSVRASALDIVAGADLVEGFETSDGEQEPGTVLVIDPDHAGRLEQSARAYDRRVAGVVSGAGGVDHGIRLGQPGVDGDTLVAMTGRVWVKATAAGGAIRPGDRLTTSDVPGRAMRVSDETRAAGAVIGKAMSALADGEGLVLVLVNLQ